MFGAYVRGGLTVVISVFAAALLEYLTPFFLPFLGPEESLLYRSFDWLGTNALLIMLVAVAAGVLARATVEANPGVR
jgi:hypothetical protein